MRPRHRQPAKRLLILPATLLGAILAVVLAVPSATVREPDADRRVDEVADVLPAPQESCRRDRSEPVEARPPLRPGDGRVTSAMLVACPVAFDDRIVTYTGEVVGDLFQRDGGAWVLVNDDAYALEHGPLPAHREHRGSNSGLSVWLPDELVGELTGLGRPDQRGDVVELQGRVLRTDPEDGGGLTLRASTLTVLRPAEPVAGALDVPQAVLAAVSLLAAAVLWIVRRRARELA